MTLTLDTTAFKSSLSQYGGKVSKANEVSLDKAARGVEATQRRILLVNVKDNSGTLMNSITIRKKTGERIIGPNIAIAPYAGWIESGSNESSFKGYHYVKNSIRKNQQSFINDIKKDLTI